LTTFRAAVRDRFIARNPCEGFKLPQRERHQVESLETRELLALIDAMPGRYRALAVLGADAGLRQGEALGVTLGEIDFLRRFLAVGHQLVTMPGRAPCLAPPKTTASVRTVPLPDFVTSALAEHLSAWLAAETLDTYGHRWPDSEDRTRRAIDEVLGCSDRAISVDISRTPGPPR